MSDVTDTVKAYKAGRINLDQLQAHLLNRKWTPTPHTDPAEVSSRQGVWEDQATDGSGEELLQTHLAGLLTHDEYVTLVKAIWAKTHPG